MGTTLCCCCEDPFTRYGLVELKRRIEGDRRRVLTSPEVWVTVEELYLVDDGEVYFNAFKFSLKGLKFHTLVEVKGTATELAAIAASKGTETFLTRIGVSTGKRSTVMSKLNSVGARLSVAKDAAKQKVSSVGLPTSSDSRTVRINVAVDLDKHLHRDEVVAKVRELETDIKGIEMVLSVQAAREVIERAISSKASEVVTRLKKQRLEEKFEICGCPSC